MTTEREVETRERADLVETLDKHRGFLRQTVRGLTDEGRPAHHRQRALSGRADQACDADRAALGRLY
jgi:hypothetical protein